MDDETRKCIMKDTLNLVDMGHTDFDAIENAMFALYPSKVATAEEEVRFVVSSTLVCFFSFQDAVRKAGGVSPGAKEFMEMNMLEFFSRYATNKVEFCFNRYPED